MSDPLADFDAARERLEQIVATAHANTQRAADVAARSREISVTVMSPRGEVAVTAKPGGRITAVVFEPAAFGMEGAALGRLVVATIARAQHDAAREFADAASAGYGADSVLAARLRADASAAFPDAELRAPSDATGGA